MTDVRAEPGSFRDPANRVFYAGGEVFRGLGTGRPQDWRALAASDSSPRMVGEGKICRTEAADPAPHGDGWATVLRHERIPFVSYPYEWSLRDAARRRPAAPGDAAAPRWPPASPPRTARRTTCSGAAPAPVFIDIGSFEPARDGRAVGRLPAVLPDAALPADAPGPPRPRLPAVAAGPDRRHRARRRCAGSSAAPPVRGGRAQARPPARRDAVAATPTQHRRGPRRSCATPASPASWSLATVRAMRQAGPQAGLAAAGQRTGAATRGPAATPTTTGRAKERVRRRGAGRGRRHRPRAGPRRQRRHLLADGRRARRLRGRRRGRPRGRRPALPRSCAPRAAADPAAGDGPRRPVAGRRLAGRRAGARSPAGRRADTVLALARRAPPRDRPQRPAAARSSTGWPALGRRAWSSSSSHPDDPMARRLLANKPAGLFPDYHREAFERLLGERFDDRAAGELPGGTRTLYAGVRRG